MFHLYDTRSNIDVVLTITCRKSFLQNLVKPECQQASWFLITWIQDRANIVGFFFSVGSTRSHCLVVRRANLLAENVEPQTSRLSDALLYFILYMEVPDWYSNWGKCVSLSTRTLYQQLTSSLQRYSECWWQITVIRESRTHSATRGKVKSYDSHSSKK